jgi:hypothetical protein
VAQETIRRSMARVIQDTSMPEGVREFALEVLHWRLRDRFAQCDDESASDDRVTLKPKPGN